MGVYKALTKAASKEGSEEAKKNGINKKNKQRVLILSSRGVTYRQRHLLNDLAVMMPHGRKDVKFDSKSSLNTLNELAELYNCNNVLFFEARKAQDLYVWMSKVPNGPTIKFHAQNIHTMDELHFTGNCLRGSRPILSFDDAFSTAPHLQLIREVLTHIFGVPQGHRKSKPFIDHVLAFSVADGKIWFRNYQVGELAAGAGLSAPSADSSDNKGDAKKDGTGVGLGEISLVEIGPRMVLTPIVIQEGSFGGPIVYQNSLFVSPNQVRADLRRSRAGRHHARAEKDVERKARRGELGLARRADGSTAVPAKETDTKVLFS